MPAGFDPVRDAIQSPVTTTPALPPAAAYAYSTSAHSTPTSNFAAHGWHQPQQPPIIATTAMANSPTVASRRATDLSMLLNADDRVPSPSYARRQSSPFSSLVSSPATTSAPHLPPPHPVPSRTRSAHLSHILQPENEPGGSSGGMGRSVSGPGQAPTAHSAVTPVATGHSAFTASPTSSPPTLIRDLHYQRNGQLQKTSHSPQLGHQIPELPRRLSSVTLRSSPSPSLPYRSPEVSRPSTSSTSMLPPPARTASLSPSPKLHHPLVSHPRQPIPYAPRNRRTPADSVMRPITTLEREFYKNCVKNPLRAQALKKKMMASSSGTFPPDDSAHVLGKRRRDTILSNELNSRENNPTKRSRDVEAIADHCACRLTTSSLTTADFRLQITSVQMWV